MIFGTDTLRNATGSAKQKDAFVVKYNNNGDLLWTKPIYGYSGDEDAKSIATSSVGNILVGGYSSSTEFNFGVIQLINGNIGSHLFMVQYDNNGNDVWAVQAGEGYNGGAEAVTFDNADNIIAAGDFMGARIIFGNYVLYNANASNKDLFICKMGMTVGVGTLENNNKISVSPNPFTFSTTLQTDKTFKNATATIFDLYGRAVKQMENISEKTIVFRRDNLASGMYFVHLIQDGKVIATDKLVITDK
jgi:hypothetical protein